MIFGHMTCFFRGIEMIFNPSWFKLSKLNQNFHLFRTSIIWISFNFVKFKIISANGKKTMTSISKIFQCGTKEDQRRAWTPRNWTVVITWQHGQNLRRVNNLDYMSQLYQVCSYCNLGFRVPGETDLDLEIFKVLLKSKWPRLLIFGS